MENEYTQIRSGLGVDMYTTPCADCGAPVKTWVRRRSVVFKCKECREKEKEEANRLKNQITGLTKLRRVEAAKELITKLYGSIEGYEHAFEVIESKLDKPNWFQSINEVLAAAELIRSKVKAHHQVKVQKYRVDFVLPNQKVLLEIDGVQHSFKPFKEKDRLKEAILIAKFGPQWEIIRINDNLIRQNLKKLVPAIEEMVKKRRRMRNFHKGQLPKNYSQQI